MEDSSRVPVGDSPVQGPDDALVTVVEFGDARDVFTARARRVLAALRARYGDALRIVWKTHPRAVEDPAGALVAEALESARAQGRFWAMLDRVLERDNPTAADLETIAQSLGLEMARYRRELDAHVHRPRIEADGRLSAALDTPNITPVFYVNGTRVVGVHRVERYLPLIDAALAAARAITPATRAYARTTAEPVADPEGVPPPPPGRSHVIDPQAIHRVPIEGAPVAGPPEALVTVVAFEDFQCPACASVEPTLAELRRRYPNELRIVWRNLPLWVHPDAPLAAEAAMEAFVQGGDAAFWRFHDTLFAHRGSEGWLERPALERYAREQGLDLARFAAALDAHAHDARVQADVRLATRFGLMATPGFFVNGRLVRGVQPLERFVALIERALVEARERVRQGTPPRELYARLTAAGATEVSYLPAAPDAQPGHPPEPRYTVPENAAAPFLGRAGGAVRVEHFGDFESAASGRFRATLDQIVQAYGDRVRITWRDYPTAQYANAMLAAEAAREVFAQQGNAGFWRFRSTLLSNQGALTRADLERYARAQRVDLRRFAAALDAHTHAPAIRLDLDAADLTGAPLQPASTFIDGRLVPANAPFAEFQRVLDAALAARGQGQGSGTATAIATTR
jgi:protein-disulfide isomerase